MAENDILQRQTGYKSPPNAAIYVMPWLHGPISSSEVLFDVAEPSEASEEIGACSRGIRCQK